MVDISSQNNKINITVSTGSNTSNVNATPDSARYYSGKSEEWATSEKLVDNKDYSSKYYANESKKQADISTAKATEVVESGNNAIANIESAKDEAITDITNQETTSKTVLINEGATQVGLIQNEGATQVNLAKAEVAKATTQANNAANSASQAEATLNSVTTTINTEKTNAVNAVKAQQNTSVAAVQNQQNSSVNAVKSTGQSYVDKCKAWASSPNVVEGGLRSAKYYAEQAQGKSDVTYEHLRASRAYEDKGALLTDEQGYAEVAKYNRSTFDKSKFTVVGSPTITEDGVVSGFSKTNYLTIPKEIINSLIGHKWRIDYKFINKPDSDKTYPRVLLGTKFDANTTNPINLGLFNMNYYWFANLLLSDGSRTTNFYNVLDNTNFGSMIGYLEFDGNNYTNAVLQETDTSWQIKQVASNLSIAEATEDLKIGYGLTSGSIDLKQFSITVDGKEVFKGNKTGLDVIKEDSYEVVGSPVISDDGMLLSASKNNFINTGFNISNLLNKSWKIEGRWEYNGVNQSYNILCALAGHYVFFGGIAYRTTDFRLAFFGNFGDKDDNTGGDNGILVRLNKNPETIDYRLEFDITTGQYTLYYSLDGGAYLSKTYIPNTANKQLYNISVDNNRFLTIGGTTADNLELGNKIDLNSFKIYVDGNLVYQPCLKIPYNISKTGSKIVPAYTRDRLIDLYEQEGYAGYYTIDEENKNFTLPMGEIYGLIGQRSLKSSMVTENFRVDIYSDKTCLICGNVATAGTINLPIELANNNYFVTLSASTKTATSFVTTTTGDYILIGKVV